MSSHRMPSWLALMALMVLAAGGLSWLLFGLAGSQRGQILVTSSPESAVEFLPDSSALTLAEVAQTNTGWQRLAGAGFIQTPPGEKAWIRITLRNSSPKPQHGILENADIHTDRVELFLADTSEAERWQRLASGEKVPLLQRPLWGRSIAFPVTIPAQGESVVYLRACDHFAIWQEFTWWPNQQDFHSAQLRDVLTEGAYFGTLLALLFYNVVLWVRLQFPDTGRYLLYLGSFIAYMFIARSMPPLFGWALGSPWMEVISMMALALSGAFLAEFARVFLELKSRAPKANRVARIISGIMIVLALGSLASPWSDQTDLIHYILLAAILTHLILAGVAFTAWRAGVRQARYFLLSFGLLFVSMTPVLLISVFPIPLDIAARTIMIGSALEMLLLSIGTADRFAVMQRETIRVQKALLEETEQRQALQEAYADELEVEVRERTRDLATANEDKDRIIAVLAHDLRSPLTGITQTAEQLTALPASGRIAQFINDSARIGRHLLLMIEDLALWAQLRSDKSQAGTYPVQSLITPVVTLHRSLADRENITLIVEGPSDLAVEVDRVLAQTLVRNLLVNAIKFARHRVIIRTDSRDHDIRISVRDDGPGLPSSVAAQLNNSEPVNLTINGGLGLRLCSEISRVIGTRLEVTLPEDGGTELSFTLPSASGGLL